MITKDAIETAYCFMHQKWRVYKFSTMDWQKDDIEYAIGNYVEEMDKDLFDMLSAGKKDFLQVHANFAQDIAQAIDKLESMME